MASPLTIVDVNTKLDAWLKSIDIPENNHRINQYRHLVSASTKYNKAFIDVNFPSLKFSMSTTPVDVNLVASVLTSGGVNVSPLNVYGHDTIGYLNKMEEYHHLMLENLRFK